MWLACVTHRKENVLRLWNELLELLKRRRVRLDVSLKLYHVFQEMIYILDWIDEIRVRRCAVQCMRFEADAHTAAYC